MSTLCKELKGTQSLTSEISFGAGYDPSRPFRLDLPFCRELVMTREL
jgi:hypothetical protein